MLRLGLTLTLAFHVGLTAGAAMGTESICLERCDDDDAQGNCAADCADCASCPHAQTFAVTAQLKEPSAVGDARVPERAPRVYPSPDPGDILHVPKAVLA